MRHTHPAAPPVTPAPAAATKPGNRGIDTTMLCGILDIMSPPAAQKPYDKLMALLTTGDGACRLNGAAALGGQTTAA